MKRKIVTVLIIIICFLLESTMFQLLDFGSVTPNLLVIVTAAFGFMRGQEEGMFVGFICGLITDIMFGGLFGFYALVYTVLGFLNGYFRKIFYPDDIKLPLILIASSDFIYGNIIYIFQFLLRSRFNYFYYLKSIIIPELIYTILITLLLYQGILLINQKLEAEEKRSASKFV